MLWTEKYRPKTLEDFVFTDDTTEKKIREWVKKKDFPHLLFYGPAGCGKSSAVALLTKDIKDSLRINCSNDTGIDSTRQVIDYAGLPPVEGDFKVVIMEEADRLSGASLDSLKVVLEDYSEWCRFIFTTNNVAKITAPIKSRCQDIEFKKLNEQQFITRIVYILNAEGVKITDNSIVVQYLKAYYPDMRKCIGALEKNSIDGELKPLVNTGYSNDVYADATKGFLTSGSMKNLRNLLSTNLTTNDYEGFYRYLYDNIDEYVSDTTKYEKCIVKIAEYLYKNAFVADFEINLVACLIELEQIIKG